MLGLELYKHTQFSSTSCFIYSPMHAAYQGEGRFGQANLFMAWSLFHWAIKSPFTMWNTNKSKLNKNHSLPCSKGCYFICRYNWQTSVQLSWHFPSSFAQFITFSCLIRLVYMFSAMALSFSLWCFSSATSHLAQQVCAMLRGNVLSWISIMQEVV